MNIKLSIYDHYVFDIEVSAHLKNGETLYKSYAINPPPSFWDNKKEFVGNTIEDSIWSIAKALQGAIDSQNEV